MKIFDVLNEGGWDSTVTQSTVIGPAVVKSALEVAKTFAADFSQWLKSSGIPPVTMGSPTGSSAYHDVDPEDKVYGDIDLQMIAEPIKGTPSQFASFYNKLVDDFIAGMRPNYIHYEGKPANGHIIVSLGDDKYVQIDLIWTTPDLSHWARWRMTPERNVKGLIYGNMYSSLGEIMGLAIQHSGVQMKIKNDQPISYQRGRKEDRIETLSTNIERFAYDLLVELYKRIHPGRKDLKVSPTLREHPGLDTRNVKIADLAQAIKGLAESFEMNDMYGKHVLSDFANKKDFLNKFLAHYIQKANEAAGATKFDKAETPEAKARAQDTKDKIAKGVELVKGYLA